MTDAVEEVESGLLQLGRHFSALTGRSRRRAGVLDQSAYTILSFMQARGNVTYPDLEGALGLEQSTLNRQVNALVRAGYAERRVSGRARVPASYGMTAAGLEAWRDEHRMTLGALEILLSDWTAEERRVFATLLRRFNLSIESKTGLRWPAVEGGTAAKNA